MSQEINQIEQIELYIEGRLSNADRAEFENLLNNDSTLADKVAFHKTVTAGIHNLGLRSELNGIHHRLYGGSKGQWLKWSLSILLIGLASLGIWYMTQESHETETRTQPKMDVIIETKNNITPEPEKQEAPTSDTTSITLSKNEVKEKVVRTVPQYKINIVENDSEEAADILSEETVENEMEEPELVERINQITSSFDSTTLKEMPLASPVIANAKHVVTPFDSLNNLMNEIFITDPKIRTTKIGDPKQMMEFTGNKGTFVSIPPNSLKKPNGKLPNGNVRIELDEYYEPHQLFTEGLPTISNGKMLESGGVVHLAIYDEDETELMVRVNSSIGLSFLPIERNSKDPFGTFYGNRDEYGLMNWSTNISRDPDERYVVEEAPVQNFKGKTFSNAETREAKTLSGYINLKSKELGWINCDRFYDKKTSPIVMNINNAPKNAVVAIIFKDIKSVLTTNLIDAAASFEAPNKMDIWVIGVGTEDEEDYFFIEDTNTSDLKDVSFAFEKAPKWKIKKALAEVQFNELDEDK